MKLNAGDWVEVRTREEILKTLDKNCRLEELPFMPQMFEYCGKQFRVYKRAHKTCDTVNPVAGKRINDAVHLDLRCDGKAYGGCQAECLIFWKNAWLKPVGKTGAPQLRRPDEFTGNSGKIDKAPCTEEDVLKSTRAAEETGSPRYFCQATQLPHYTTPLQWWDARQYLEDYLSGNVGIRRIFNGTVFVSYYYLSLSFRNRIGRPGRWLYDRFQALIGGVPYPRRWGTIPDGQPTPVAYLDLQPGELVRVRSYQEILATLDGVKNRGMVFDAEMVPYCGRVFRVKKRIERFINEKTGKMSSLKTPAVMLEDVWCQSRYAWCRMFCPRSIYIWWREIWLERVDENFTTPSKPHEAARTIAAGRFDPWN